MPADLTDRLDAFEAFTVELNRAAGEVILPLFRGAYAVDDKGESKGAAYDPVTAADRAAEAAIRSLISSHYPEHGVIGEEYGEDRPDAEWVWVLDPIDGTRAFLAGFPVWTTLIALRHAGRPVVGSIGQPYLGEQFIGTSKGARLLARGRTQPLHVRPCVTLKNAVIATTDPYLYGDEEAQAWTRLRTAVRLARFGVDAYAYAMVAAGQLDLVVETGLKAWDIDAALPLLQGAGGSVTDWEGRPVGGHGGRVILTGDRRVSEAASDLLLNATS
jgi:histidinol phosphatase-like enzyme (inositol monophosphatase family)